MTKMTGQQVRLFPARNGQVTVKFPQEQEPFRGGKVLVLFHQPPPLFWVGLVGGQLSPFVGFLPCHDSLCYSRHIFAGSSVLGIILLLCVSFMTCPSLIFSVDSNMAPVPEPKVGLLEWLRRCGRGYVGDARR